jgi:hypothetical protein
MSADGLVRALGYVRMSLDERYHTGAGMAAQRPTIVAECEHRKGGPWSQGTIHGILNGKGVIRQRLITSRPDPQ